MPIVETAIYGTAMSCTYVYDVQLSTEKWKQTLLLRFFDRFSKVLEKDVEILYLCLQKCFFAYVATFAC